MKCSCLSLAFLFLFMQSGCTTEVDENINHDYYYQMETDKPFEEVLDDAIFAITERNFRLTSHLHIGKSIRDRKNPDFPDYEVLLYCNLSHAKKMLELDPNMISSCPGRITVRQNGDRVNITAPLWPEKMKDNELKLHMQKLNGLIREIVDYAADDWLLVYDRKSVSSE
ncbi:MAG: DUF302 domain-containing protein [Gammaproteobacteria bacterium]|nr:MAG: DUF302 domain-containing protein [Gammaproteobacteria bacterium]